jgi:excisionase family DNA binding protein
LIHKSPLSSRNQVPAIHSPDQYISTAQAARSLGVSVSTVKRWVDEGVLPANKTAGGHRKLLRAEVLALARKGDVPHASVADLVLVAGRKQRLDAAGLREALYTAMLRGDAAEVRAFIRRAYEAGVPIESLADSVIAPLMERVGHGWETAGIDVWQEHRGTLLVAAALFELHAEISRRAEKNRPIALGGAPAADPYLLASLLAQLVLLDAGWDAVNLGPNTPLDSFVRAIRELKPRLMWLSVSHLEDPPAFIRDYRTMQAAAAECGTAIAIGGRALVEPVRAQLHYTSHGDGLSQLAALARTLHPRPRRPRRGRPPQKRD